MNLSISCSAKGDNEGNHHFNHVNQIIVAVNLF